MRRCGNFNGNCFYNISIGCCAPYTCPYEYKDEPNIIFVPDLNFMLSQGVNVDKYFYTLLGHPNVQWGQYTRIDIAKEDNKMFTLQDKKEAQWLKSEGFNWIARDREDSFSVTINKPVKNESKGYWIDNEETDMIFIPSDNSLFAKLSYEDDEPIKFDDIIQYNTI